MTSRIVLILAAMLLGIGQPAAQLSRELEFANGDVRLAAELMLPSTPTPDGCVVIIQGSGESDRGNAWARMVAEVIREAGYAVVLPDKRGSGKSTGDWRSAGFDDLARDTIAAVAAVNQTIACRLTGVAGLSQGGRVAPLAATLDSRIAFVVDVSGSAVPAERQLRHEIANDFRQSGMSDAQIAQLMGLVGLGIDFMRSDAAWDAYAARRAEMSAGALAGAVKGFPPDREHWFWSFWRRTIDFDPLPSWQKLQVPALVVYGEEDERDNVPVKESVDRLKSSANPHIHVSVVTGVGHAVMQGSQLHPFFVKTLTDWLRNRSPKRVDEAARRN